MPRVVVTTRLLREARAVIADHLDMTLTSCCVIGKNGKPRRETLDEFARRDVERMEATIIKIDAALKGGRHV